MTNGKPITGGLYLVVDLSIANVDAKVKRALDGGVDILQIWGGDQNKAECIRTLKALANAYEVPILVNESVEIFREFGLDGIHYDKLPDNFSRDEFDRAIIGVTGTNDTEQLDRAVRVGVDYISFCAVYPSRSAISCEIVAPSVIKDLRQKTSMTLFGSGGITPTNISECLELGLDGVAVISGILAADDPGYAAQTYKQAIQSYFFKTKNANHHAI